MRGGGAPPPSLILQKCVCYHDNRKVVLTTELLTNCSVTNAYRSSVQCKCKLRGLLQLNSIVSVPALKILGLKSIPQSNGAALNSNDFYIISEVTLRTFSAAVVMSLVTVESNNIIIPG